MNKEELWSDKERELHERMKQELGEIEFTSNMQSAVLHRVREKESIWHREIKIPVPVAVFICMLLVAAPFIGWLQLTTGEYSSYSAAHEREYDPLVTLPSGIFYQSELEKGE